MVRVFVFFFVLWLKQGIGGRKCGTFFEAYAQVTWQESDRSGGKTTNSFYSSESTSKEGKVYSKYKYCLKELSLI